MNDPLKALFEGAVLGLAIGDALGRPTEFLHSRGAIRGKFGPDGVRDFERDRHPAGTYTDDTQMSLCVALSLIEAGHRPLDDLMKAMAGEFVAWSNSAENDRSPGTTCMAGCRNLQDGKSWREAGVARSKGCGSAMRTAPIGLYFHDDEARLIEVARASSLPTHGHPTAQASAAAAALLTAWALHHDDPPEYPRRLAGVMRRMDGGDDVARLVERVPWLLSEPPDEVLCDGRLGEAWVADEAVAGALYCFCRSPEDYRAAALTGANTVGDSDSIACIAGAISGAYNGLAAIPEPWRRNVEKSDYLHEIADKLHAAAQGRPR